MSPHEHDLLHATITAINSLTEAVKGLHSEQSIKTAILHRLAEMENNIMSKISEFATAQKTFNDRQDAAITGLQGDVKSLTDKIAELQNSAGTVTPEDQALLDDLQTRGEAITAKLEALDALTPPPIPPPTP